MPDGACLVFLFPPIGPEWQPVATPDADVTKSEFPAIEWPPGAYTMCEAARALEISRQWIGPCHTRIDREIAELGHTEFVDVAAHFIGGVGGEGQEHSQFFNTFIGLEFSQRLRLAPHLIDLANIGSESYTSHIDDDSSL